MTTRLLATLVVLMAACPVGAQEPAPDFVKRARACAAALDYDCAEAELAVARSRLDSLEVPVKVAIMRLSAETAFATGRKYDAEGHLKALLGLDPEFAPPRGAWPSGWEAALQVVRDAMPDNQPPLMDVEVARNVRAGEPFEVRVRLSDRSGVGRVFLGVGRTSPIRLPMTTTDGQVWSAVVPGDRVYEPSMDLWLEAVDLKGNGPSRWGSEAEPRQIPVGRAPPPPPPSLVKQWWFWTVIGVVAAGAGVGIYYLTRIDRDSAAPGASGQGRLGVEVRWPSSSN